VTFAGGVPAGQGASRGGPAAADPQDAVPSGRKKSGFSAEMVNPCYDIALSCLFRSRSPIFAWLCLIGHGNFRGMKNDLQRLISLGLAAMDAAASAVARSEGAIERSRALLAALDGNADDRYGWLSAGSGSSSALSDCEACRQ
jgi:hypothetical protein